ncbi:MAG: TIM barrel protein [Planctomycetes bacterium]|nr:TIM barrel protein [Planctomycetota bacterium]MDA1265404.1 TIM barrel protein [Planctomycetota bacterium]
MQRPALHRPALSRRHLLAAGAAGLAAPLARGAQRLPNARPAGRFKLDYAPHFGMFRNHAGSDLLDQLRFMHDEGFRSLEDNGMPGKDPKTQEEIGQFLRDHDMRMGVFVAHGDFGSPTFAIPPAEARGRIEADMKRAVEVAKRCGATWCTVVPGSFRKDLEWDYQTANVIDNLRFAAEICEPSGLVMVLEPLNAWRDHPGLFLTKIPQAHMICRAVNSPSCKILNDLYHQQITEGNLIPNLDLGWSETAYIQVGDNPGRREPGTGEINYRNVFRHLHAKGYTGIVGMEHGNSMGGKEGERAVINAYAAADDFEVK